LIASAVASRLVTYGDLATVLGVEDLHDVLEIASVDAHNRRAVDRLREGDR
jgi:hypothetical protein